jgi:hypothetical protein
MAGLRLITISCVKQMLKPVVRLCLQRAIGIQEIIEIVKSCMIESAIEEIEKGGDKANTSRLSVMTGLHRRDVTRLTGGTFEIKEPVSIVSRVAGQWERDSRFNTKTGQPRILSYENNNSDFAKLVATVSRDMHHGTVLFEMNRLGMIEYVKGGIKLIIKTHNLRSDPQKAYQLVAADIGGLIETTTENLESSDLPNLQVRTEYDNLFQEDLPTIKEWVLKEGSEFHQRVRAFLSKFDADINPHIRKDAGGKVSVSSFSHMIKRNKPNETK